MRWDWIIYLIWYIINISLCHWSICKHAMIWHAIFHFQPSFYCVQTSIQLGLYDTFVNALLMAVMFFQGSVNDGFDTYWNLYKPRKCYCSFEGMKGKLSTLRSAMWSKHEQFFSFWLVYLFSLHLQIVRIWGNNIGK